MRIGPYASLTTAQVLGSVARNACAAPATTQTICGEPTGHSDAALRSDAASSVPREALVVCVPVEWASESRQASVTVSVYVPASVGTYEAVYVPSSRSLTWVGFGVPVSVSMCEAMDVP